MRQQRVGNHRQDALHFILAVIESLILAKVYVASISSLLKQRANLKGKNNSYGAFNPISQKQFERGDFHVT